MKEYILNETPLRTSEHFNINDIKVKLDIPYDYDFHDFIISNSDHVSISYGDSFSSKIGLDFDKCVDINIVVPSGFNDDILFSHEATIGKISDSTIFYLMTRGMSLEEAKALIVQGFAEPIAKAFPVEYAVEMNRLINLELEGTIG